MSDSEAGYTGTMTEAEFRALPVAQQLQLVYQVGNGTPVGTSFRDPETGDFIGAGTPTAFGQTSGWYDPAALVRNDDGTYRIRANGVNLSALEQMQEANHNEGLFGTNQLQNLLTGIGIVLGGGTLANMGFIPGVEGGWGGLGGGVDLGATGGLAPEEFAMGHFGSGGVPYGTVPGATAANPLASIPGSEFGLNVGTGLGTDLSLGSSVTGVPGLPTAGSMGATGVLDLIGTQFPDLSTLATNTAGNPSFLDRLIDSLPGIADRLPGIVDALGGGNAPGGGRVPGGGGGASFASATPGGRGAGGKVDAAENPYGKPPKQMNVLDLMSYVRGAR